MEECQHLFINYRSLGEGFAGCMFCGKFTEIPTNCEHDLEESFSYPDNSTLWSDKDGKQNLESRYIFRKCRKCKIVMEIEKC